MEQPKQAHQFCSSELTLGEVYQLIHILKRSGNISCNLKIHSDSKQFIKYLNTQLTADKQMEVQSHSIPSFLKKTDISNETNDKLDKVISFENMLTLKAFLIQYKENLMKMTKQYNLRLEWQNSRLLVYSDKPVSKLFLSQILTLKRKFVVTWVKNSELSMKSTYSLMMRKVLRQNNIYFRKNSIKHKNIIMIHSEGINVENLRQMALTFCYQSIYFLFQDQNLPMRVNRLLFELLVKNIENLIKKIQYYYQIPIELNHRKMALILHSKDSIFSKEPIKEAKSFFQNIIITGYQSNCANQQIKTLRKLKFRDSLSFSYQRYMNYIFHCWNRTKPITPDNIEKVYECMIKSIKSCNFKFRIYLKESTLKLSQRQNILDLIQKYGLQCVNYWDIINYTSNVMQLKLKSFHENFREFKQNKVLKFLQQLICSAQNQKIQQNSEQLIKNEDSDDEQDEKDEQDDELSEANSQKLQIQNAETIQEQEGNLQNESQWKVQYSLTKIMAQKYGRRSRELQKIFYEKHNLKCIIRNKCTQLPYQKFQQDASETLVRLSLFTQIEQKKLKRRLSDLNKNQAFIMAIDNPTGYQGVILYIGEVINRF